MPKNELANQQERLKKLLEYAWLNLGDPSEIEICNPMGSWSRDDQDDPVRAVLRLMRKPEYFAWTCKVVFNIELLPLQLAILWDLWTHPFPMLIGSRGLGKSFILALYAMLRAFLCQGVKVVIVGAAFRQSKVIFEYCENIWNHAPILRDICGTQGRSGPRRDVDRCTMILGDSIIMAVPLGDGTKIRGLRANYIIADEFASIPRDIFETVVSGFAVVSADPVEQVKKAARVRMLKQKGLWNEEMEARELGLGHGNQTILSGTAYYAFNHFSDYWRRWKSIIESRGNKKRLAEIFGGEDGIPPKFNHRDFSIIRIPVELLPEGFMDAKHVARSKATVHSGIYQMEFGACFATDSQGFYSRKLIESCVVGSLKWPISLPGYPDIHFAASIRGNPHMKYVFGVDPASERDKFSIVVLECHGNHRRVVFCWTTTRQTHREKIKAKVIPESDFYGYCARKIRDLKKVFPCDRISMDSQGGGVAVAEALHDADKLLLGETPIWPVVEDGKPKDTDGYPGEHILELCNFAKADWTAEANHGMRKDLEDKALLFPHFDGLSLELSLEDDKRAGRVKVIQGKEIKLYDTLEDCVTEIEELKDELATIEMRPTANGGRDRWDTPEVKLAGNKKGRLRKDRYSALLMANMSARSIMRAPPPPAYNPVGGFADQLAGDRDDDGSGRLYNMGPEWTQSNSAGGYGAVVRRG
jgi:hypothetical protein